ncbi:hypothetical protein [Actinoplanes sp. TFC3]|uniref:hypothetical protein n=1 Tax=Actinoplanes sp. TFC3 TaxID=1710355 RepID=UPI000833C4EB|nr:hypothetical protein [Actinoplanes sp. TFC3]
MSKSSAGRGFGRRSGTVTVIEQQVHRSSQRNARFAFVITAVTVLLITLVVAAQYMHPLLAVFPAAFAAAFSGAGAWVLVRIWPVLRLLWWWAPEIVLTMSAAWAWTALAVHTAPWVTLLVLMSVVGAPAVIPGARNRIVATAWCVVVRHRLRVCFSQFIIANKSGSLPFVLGAWPTPVGERVWVMLRPGLSLSYLTQQLDKIAVACHATSAFVQQAGTSDSAFIRFDIKRREVLTATVGSPLVDLIEPVAPVADKKPATVTGLDLPDVEDIPPATPAAAKTKATAASSNGREPAASAATAADDGDDISDWI